MTAVLKNVCFDVLDDIFAKGNTQNWSKEVFIISKIKNAVPWTCGISDLNGEPITGSFNEKELQKN